VTPHRDPRPVARYPSGAGTGSGTARRWLAAIALAASAPWPTTGLGSAGGASPLPLPTPAPTLVNATAGHPAGDARTPRATPPLAPSAAEPASAVLVVRSSPIAGFQFHAGEQAWRDLRVGEPLVLVREPANPHDPDAVRVDWRGLPLGYVPRRDNRQVARQLDRGMALQARVSRLRESRNPWDRVEFEVVLPLPAAALPADQSASPGSP
jgi:hypothetical protein